MWQDSEAGWPEIQLSWRRSLRQAARLATMATWTWAVFMTGLLQSLPLGWPSSTLLLMQRMKMQRRWGCQLDLRRSQSHSQVYLSDHMQATFLPYSHKQGWCMLWYLSCTWQGTLTNCLALSLLIAHRILEMSGHACLSRLPHHI